MVTPTHTDMPRSRYHGRRMSLAEYEALPEEQPSLEYWGGVVIQKAVGKRKHLRATRELDVALALYCRSYGGDSGPEGHIFFAYKSGWLVPDVSYWAPGKPQGDDDRMLPPTLAIEVRSPGELLADQREKCRNMRASGVDVCWLIDPETRRAERFEGEADGMPFPAGGALESPFLPGFSLPLADLFAALDG